MVTLAFLSLGIVSQPNHVLAESAHLVEPWLISHLVFMIFQILCPIFETTGDCQKLSAISATVNWNLALGDILLQQFLTF